MYIQHWQFKNNLFKIYNFQYWFLIFEYTVLYPFLSIRFLEYGEPFRRKIHPDELWLYKNPRTESYVTTRILWVNMIFLMLSVLYIHA